VEGSDDKRTHALLEDGGDHGPHRVLRQRLVLLDGGSVEDGQAGIGDAREGLVELEWLERLDKAGQDLEEVDLVVSCELHGDVG
jgi:hypothetical protein